MLSFAELQRVVSVLGATRIGARIDKIVQSDPEDIVLHLSGGTDLEASDRLLLLLSCRKQTGRISALPRPRQAPAQPPGFAQYLKAHVDGGRLREVKIEGADRQVRLRVETREGVWSILVSLLGPRSNLYALDEQDHVVASARPLGETRRDLSMNAPWADPDGSPPRAGDDRFAEFDDGDYLAAVEAHYADREAGTQDDQRRSRIRKALKKRVAALEKKVRLLEEDLAAGEAAPRWERLGELLKSRLRDVKPGMTSISISDFETGEPVDVPLEPKLSAQKNLDQLFRKARKAEKRARKAAGDIDTARERLTLALRLQEDAEGADEDRLAEIASDPEVERLLDRYFPEPKAAAAAPKKKVWKIGKRELPTRLVPKRYVTSAGLEVWVGKNDEGNDMLTTRLARGNDLFFHLEGNPGSHVILRTEGKGDPPPEALLEAAELSVNFSKAKNASRAPVHVAECKDITKPSGAKPGLVYVHRGRTIQLKRSAERLKRILDSRLDD